MKKHDEGYALPLVIIVMLILCLVALSVMSVALMNLQNQQASIDRMQQQYTAQGKIENLLGILESLDPDGDTPRTITLEELCHKSGTAYQVSECSGATCRVRFTASDGGVTVACVLDITSKANIQSGASYTLDRPSYEYVSYDASAEPAEGGDGDG